VERRGLSISVVLDPAPLLEWLGKHKAKRLVLTISHPRAAYNRCTPASKKTTAVATDDEDDERGDTGGLGATAMRIVYSACDFRVGQDPPRTIHLEFGYRLEDLSLPAALMAAMLILPIAFSLWRYRSLTHSLSADRAAADFGFGMFVRWVVSATWV